MAYYKIIGNFVGNDAGPFTIKTNTGQVLATGITRLQILAGYTVNVPAGATDLVVTSDPANTECVTDQTFPIPNEGFWEAEKSNVETVSDHYGAIQANYVAPVEMFVADDIVGIYTGIVSGALWTIKAGPEDIYGTTYNGGGTLIVTNANTNSATTVEAGAVVQLGYTLSDEKGSFGGTTTVQAGAVVNVIGANEAATPRNAFASLTNQGSVNVTGKDACGEGFFATSGAVNNTGTITIEDASFRPASYGSSVGNIVVTDGATLEVLAAGTVPAGQSIQLSGCGKCNEVGKLEGAILSGGSSTIAGPVSLQTDVCMNVNTGVTTFSGQLTGDHKLMLDNVAGSLTRTGSFTFTNATPTFTNTVEVNNTTLYNTGSNTLSQADIVLVENGYIQQDAGALNLGSLATDSTTAGVLLNGSGSLTLKANGVTTFAGALGNSTPGTPWNFRLDGPDTNKITLTGGGSATNLISADGSKIVAQGGTFNAWSSVNGGTISAGTAVPTRINTLSMSALGAIDVYASGAGVGLIWAANAATLVAGWKVNVMDALPAGVYNVLQKPNATALTLPVIGTNASGLTATFANVGSYIQMTLTA